jgi:hypothetical protein
MAWPTPKYSKSQINRAGDILAAEDADAADLSWAHEVLGNWRACHGYPMNTFQATLRDKLARIGLSGSLVAQRLKRTPSIIAKLRRFDTMSLTRMQDIGGLRAVVPEVSDVRSLRDEYAHSKFKHQLIRDDDYISDPKDDGYRSVHRVYRYHNDGAPEYNGLAIELQIRTNLQHMWATAVETMGTFLGQALKSSQGEAKWLQFFAVTSSAFAWIEKSPRVPGYADLSKPDTFARVAAAEQELGVLDKLTGFSEAVTIATVRQGKFNLVILNTRDKKVSVRPYREGELGQAMNHYALAEARVKEGEPMEVVLVAAGKIASLRRAYPNYFLDTNEFMDMVRYIINPRGRRRKSSTPRLF